MRIWWTVALWITVLAVARAASVIVFINPANAGPRIPLEIDDQPNWVQWATPAAGDGLNRLLSIPSGIDWEGAERNFAFRPTLPHYWRSRGLADLQRRGYAVALSKRLGEKRIIALEDANGAVSTLALTVAADPRFSTVESIGSTQSLLTEGIYVTEAKNWDDVERIARRGANRLLVVEYPPLMPGHFSHLWLRGPGWENLAVAAPTKGADGYLAATDLLPLLMAEPVRTTVVEPWKTPRRWIAFAYGPARVAVGVGFVIMLIGLAAATWSVVEERRVFWRQELAAISLLVPAALLQCGWACRWLGRDLVSGWLILSLLILVLLTHGVRRLFGNNTLLATYAVGFVASITGEVIYGPVSPVFTTGGGVSLGIAIGYLGGLAGSIPRESATGPWLVRLAAMAFILLPISDPFCLAGVAPSVLIGLVFTAIACGERWIPPIVLWILAIGMPFVKGIGHGYVFSRHELYANYWDPQALNLASVIGRVSSPEWIIAGFAVIAVALVGFRFLRHQLRRLHQIDPRVGGLIALAGVLAITGIAMPTFLPVVPFLVLLGMTTTLVDVTIRV